MVKTFEDVVRENFEKGKRKRDYFMDALHYVESEAWLNKDGKFRTDDSEIIVDNVEKSIMEDSFGSNIDESAKDMVATISEDYDEVIPEDTISEIPEGIVVEVSKEVEKDESEEEEEKTPKVDIVESSEVVVIDEFDMHEEKIPEVIIADSDEAIPPFRLEIVDEHEENKNGHEEEHDQDER